MSKREEILRMLDKGKYISTKDGRCGDTFVNLWALQKLIDDELVTVFLHETTKVWMVKAKVTK